MASTAGVVLLFTRAPDSSAARSVQALWSLGHVLLFMAGTALALSFLPDQQRRRRYALALLLVAAGLLAWGSEWAQAVVGRVSDPMDAIRDLGGAGVALLIGWPWRGRRWGLRPLSVAAGSALLIVLAWPFLETASDECLARWQFPVLADFESDSQLGRWEGQAERRRDRTVAAEGRASLRIELGTGGHSGVALRYFPHDWRGYAAVSCRLFVPGQEGLEMVLRIQDGRHTAAGSRQRDRFNRRLRLPPGWSLVRVPLAEVAGAPAGRPMDLADIRGLGLFVTRQATRRVVFLDDLRLEP
ncbi:MAG: hypothetical protein AB1634_19285 [Thermodesulfobacteriota bacterium]